MGAPFWVPPFATPFWGALLGGPLGGFSPLPAAKRCRAAATAALPRRQDSRTQDPRPKTQDSVPKHHRSLHWNCHWTRLKLRFTRSLPVETWKTVIQLEIRGSASFFVVTRRTFQRVLPPPTPPPSLALPHVALQRTSLHSHHHNLLPMLILIRSCCLSVPACYLRRPCC